MLQTISPGPVTAVTLSLAQGWILPFQGVQAGLNDSVRIGVSQLGFSRLSFTPDPQRNKPSCYQWDAGKLCLMNHFLLTVQWAQAECERISVGIFSRGLRLKK